MKKICTVIVSFVCTLSFAQIEENKEQIKQEEVVVQRVYEPNVAAMEKIKQTPVVTAPKIKKQSIEYSPKDIAAASDFKTTNINPAQLPIKTTAPYKNYVKAGYGNNATLRASAFFNHNLDAYKSIGFNASFMGTKADLKEYNVTNNTNESKLNGEAFFNYNLDDALFLMKAGVNLHRLNLYGLPEYNSTGFADKEVMQRFTDIYVSSKYNVYNGSALKSMGANAYYFNNYFGSNELGMNVGADLDTGDLYEADFFGGVVLGGKSTLDVEYSYTHFDDKYDEESKFNHLSIGAQPQVEIKNEYLLLSAGVNLHYLNESNAHKSDFRLFPAAELKVMAAPEFNIYGGVIGGVNNNTYKNTASINPFIRPSFELEPTINKIEFYVGINGDIGSSFKYSAKTGFQNLEKEAFFIKSKMTNEAFGYGYGNSFDVVYDDATRTYIEGNINYIGVDKLALGANVQVQSYSLETLEKAFEKPSLSGDVNAQYSLLGERLILGGALLFTGERKGLTYVTNNTQPEMVTLKSYLDLNFEAHFLINEQWSVFAELNNLLNNNYERFADYRVQGFTALGGVQYKF